MTRRQCGRQARAAFTLIELLVVIFIIAVLVSLTTAAVMKIFAKGPQIQTRVEIGNLESAIANAKANLHNVNYIPSRLVLREDGAYGTSSGQQGVDEQRTLAWLQQAFGRRIATQIDWNNDGQIQTGAAGTYYLNGSQCLVFVLGGIQVNGAPTGFSTNPANPAAPGGTRKGPFFEFVQKRLVPWSGAGGAAGWLVYVDNYGKNMPYLYMSSYPPGNNYNAGNAGSDGGSVNPYMSSTTPLKFINANTFQIISAGADGVYGPGGFWNPASGYGGGGAGADDQANFSGGMLGNPQS